MDRDGTRDGYDLDLIRTIADSVSVPVIASGGVGGLDDLVAGIRDGHASAVLAARSGEHTSELQSLMRHSYAVFCLKKKSVIDHNARSGDKPHHHGVPPDNNLNTVTATHRQQPLMR